MRSYSHLSEDERDQIGVLRAVGRSMGAIARALGRAKATISRELQRNALPLGGYSPLHAAGAYQLRRRRRSPVDSSAAVLRPRPGRRTCPDCLLTPCEAL
jgi:transposase, IS30 family